MEMVDRYLGNRFLRWGALGLALIGAVRLLLWPSGRVTYRIDLDVYRTGAQVFLDGGELYGPLPKVFQGLDLPFTYPPIAAALFTVFTIIPLWLASVLLTLVSVGCVAVVLRIVLGQTCERPLAQLWWLVAAAMAGGLWFGPIRETLVIGQVNAVLMALIVVDAIHGRGKWWGGSLVGLAIAVKLTPAVFLLLFVLRKDWRGAASTGVSFLVFTGIGYFLMPQDSLEYWTHTLLDTDRIGNAASKSNQSINAVLYRIGLDGGTRFLVWLVVSMIVGLLIAWVAMRLLKYGHDVAATISVGFVALFCSPVSWGHHWVWSLPLVVLMLVWAARTDADEKRWLLLAGSGAAVFLIRPQWRLPYGNNIEMQWSALQQLVGSAYLVWGIVALVVMGFSAQRLGRGDTSATRREAITENRPDRHRTATKHRNPSP